MTVTGRVHRDSGGSPVVDGVAGHCALRSSRLNRSGTVAQDASHRETTDAAQYDVPAASVTSALALPKSSLMRTLKPLASGKWLYYRDTYDSDRPLPAIPAEKK